ncbi:DUF2946 domain-containing protein [Undibacterium terreum]|uniref:DUF2946 domain-containing protein n=1 Tax=Undibacterium terreum TaxID=1224302 RepID=UPI00166A9A17|nr:DUF2946 domain-containing protein [Undibacterium terreum]
MGDLFSRFYQLTHIRYNACMGYFFRRSKLPLWIAYFAILLNAFAPSISYALASRQPPAGLGEICSTSSNKSLSLTAAIAKPESGKSSPDTKLHHLEHCPLCLSHAGSFALPVSLPGQFALGMEAAQFPPLFYHSPAPLFLWSQANPRAPPFIS